MALGSSGPVEAKVSAATIGAVLSGLAVWALRTYVFRGDLPEPVDAAVQALVPAAVAFLAGFLARHTPRPDLQAKPAADEAQTETGAHARDGVPRPGQDHELPAEDLFKPQVPPR